MQRSRSDTRHGKHAISDMFASAAEESECEDDTDLEELVQEKAPTKPKEVAAVAPECIGVAEACSRRRKKRQASILSTLVFASGSMLYVVENPEAGVELVY
jgi:hypothetical protein